jgi:uncharacterized membrane protein
MRGLHYSRAYVGAGMLSLATSLLYAVIAARTGKTYFDFLVWNLFLAWLPCLAAVMIDWLRKKWTAGGSLKLILMLGFAAMWLLFYPNSPYIITDLIHLTIHKNTYVSHGTYISAFWIDLVMIVLFAWNGLLLAFLSMYHLHSMIYTAGFRRFSWLFVGLVCLLSGYGIWLGRVPRLNSWDVFTDGERVLLLIKQSVEGETLLFAGLFAVFIALVYVSLLHLLHSSNGTR